MNKRHLRVVLFLFAILVVLYGICATNHFIVGNVSVKDNRSSLGQIDPIIVKLAQCESNNRWDIKVMDSNHKYSYGGLQFQLETFYLFGKRYGILDKKMELREAENLVYDKETQIAIATRMIEDGLLKDHWKICYHRINGQTML